MPLYEYQCDACGHSFEQIQKFSDPRVKKCPSCGANAVHKLISSPAIQFKGTGWYITDYAKKDQAPGEAEKSDKKQESDAKQESTEASESKSTDSKDAKPSKDVKSEKGSKGESTTTTTTKTSGAKRTKGTDGATGPTAPPTSTPSKS